MGPGYPPPLVLFCYAIRVICICYFFCVVVKGVEQKSTSEYRGSSPAGSMSVSEFAKTPLSMLNHYRCGSISCPLII